MSLFRVNAQCSPRLDAVKRLDTEPSKGLYSIYRNNTSNDDEKQILDTWQLARYDKNND